MGRRRELAGTLLGLRDLEEIRTPFVVRKLILAVLERAARDHLRDDVEDDLCVEDRLIRLFVTDLLVLGDASGELVEVEPFDAVDVLEEAPEFGRVLCRAVLRFPRWMRSASVVSVARPMLNAASRESDRTRCGPRR